MKKSNYDAIAEALEFVHGTKAMSEAVKHAELCETAGDSHMVNSWQKVAEQLKSPKDREYLNAA